MDTEVIHIDFKPAFCDHIGKNVVHECLERGWGVAKSEEHYSGFKESKGGDECSFPLICLLDSDVVVSPSDVKLSEQGGIFHVIDEFRNKWQGVCVSNCVRIQVPIVLTWTK